MQTWHHVLEKSEPQINNINALHGPFRRLLFNSGLGQGRGCDGVGEEFDFNGAVSMKAGSSVSHSARAT
jgi:hypothetical protein